MATLLYRLGQWSAHRRWAVLATWLVVLVGVGAGALGLKGTFSDSFSIPGTPAQTALTQLTKEIPGAGGSTGRLVFAAPKGRTVLEPAYQKAIQAAVKKAVELPGVTSAGDPYTGQTLLPSKFPPVTNPNAQPTISPAGQRIGFSSIQMQGQLTEVPIATQDALQKIANAAEVDGLQVELGGAAVKQQPAIGSTEGLGVIVAMVVLLITFGSLVAAGLPMLTALIGVATGLSGVLIVSGFVDMSSTAPILALMLGLAVGIDYALFIVSRHRQQVAGGMEIKESIARATGTAGSAVVFAGLTVIIALSALSVVGIPFLTVMGLAAAGTVLVAVLIAITLLPALLAFSGKKILGRKARAAVKDTPVEAVERPINRWAKFVARRPALIVIIGVIGLGIIALPVTKLHLSLPDDGVAATDSTKRQAYDLLAEGFGAGFNGPLVVTVSQPDPSKIQADAAAVVKRLGDLKDVTVAQVGAISQDGKLAVISVIPASGPADVATEDLVSNIRQQAASIAGNTGATIAVTGQTALAIDVSQKLSDALPIYLIIVVGLALILLSLVFRSIVVPIKAAVGFLLSIGASFGAVVAIYQWGWFGLIETPAPIVSFLPILLIGVLFGLAMDYEVFLLAGMRESYVHGEEPKRAVQVGFTAGSRVVTAAAIIMTSVFAGFILAPDTIIASIGFALGIGVLIDAFVVRMTLVPAVMILLGKAAWYLPAWLGRVMPNIDIEGEELLKGLDHPAAEPDEDRELVTSSL